jgi:hypothetical protein
MPCTPSGAEHHFILNSIFTCIFFNAQNSLVQYTQFYYAFLFIIMRFS